MKESEYVLLNHRGSIECAVELLHRVTPALLELGTRTKFIEAVKALQEVQQDISRKIRVREDSHDQS